MTILLLLCHILSCIQVSGGKGHHWLVAHSVLVFESQKNEGTIKKDLAKHNRTQVGLQYYDPLGKHSTVTHDIQVFFFFATLQHCLLHN